MNQQEFNQNNQLKYSLFNFQCGKGNLRQNFISPQPLSSYAPNDNVKHEIKYSLINQNLKQINSQPPKQAKQEENVDFFEIQQKTRKQKYKRSTNNSHKKFISALRRIFFSVISIQEKDKFQNKYYKYRSSRTFFFIILVYMKYRFSKKMIISVEKSFNNEMNRKIKEYDAQISRTKYKNLQNFRKEEIVDIRYSIKSCKMFLDGNTHSAIECMYKKDKQTVVKRSHFEKALRDIHEIEKELKQNPMDPLQSPYIEQFSESPDQQKNERRAVRQEIRYNQNPGTQPNVYSDPNLPQDLNGFDETNDRKTKEIRPTAESEHAISAEEEEPEEHLQEGEIVYPPMLQALPFIKYDPFVPPFRYKQQTRFRMDVREDFFGPFNYGIPKFYQRPQFPIIMNQQFVFTSKFPERF